MSGRAQSPIAQQIIGGGSSNIAFGGLASFVLLNAFVALAGYYVAALTVDTKWMGRVRMQLMGFFVSALLFFVSAGDYENLKQPGNIPAYEFIYLATSFWGQWGPNVTTWLLPVELFPTDIRSEAHGFCAATGKFGALLATLVFTYAPNVEASVSANIPNVFWVCGAFCLAGFLVTLVFVPDVTHEDLHALDRRWSVDRKAGVDPAP